MVCGGSGDLERQVRLRSSQSARLPKTSTGVHKVGGVRANLPVRLQQRADSNPVPAMNLQTQAAVAAMTDFLDRKDSVHSAQQIGRVRLHDVTTCTRAKSFLHHVSRRFLAKEQYLRLGGEPVELSSGLDSI
jgi:hypothetical protein